MGIDNLFPSWKNDKLMCSWRVWDRPNPQIQAAVVLSCLVQFFSHSLCVNRTSGTPHSLQLGDLAWHLIMPYFLGPELIQRPRNDSFLFKERRCAKIISQSLPDLEFLEVKIGKLKKKPLMINTRIGYLNTPMINSWSFISREVM